MEINNSSYSTSFHGIKSLKIKGFKDGEVTEICKAIKSNVNMIKYTEENDVNIFLRRKKSGIISFIMEHLGTARENSTLNPLQKFKNMYFKKHPRIKRELDTVENYFDVNTHEKLYRIECEGYNGLKGDPHRYEAYDHNFNDDLRRFLESFEINK
ncbi:MAG: hypothetical protein MJ230_06255 [bacterium]|nr:hypothetical protein [bacterium]